MRIAGFAEDIGRHNAVDKAVGAALFGGAVFSRLIMTYTGRLTSEIVLRAVRLGVPALASISAPSDAGVNLARKANLTLVGFVRGRRFNVYSCHERLLLS